MQNCQMRVEGNKLTIEIDLSQRLHRSATGKTVIVGTTSGNAAIPGHPNVKVGVNVFAGVEKGA